MKPYSKNKGTKGLAGCRKSTDTPHRRRSLRVDKKAARQAAKEELWNANPDCTHEIIDALGGGVKCIKCAGWMCY